MRLFIFVLAFIQLTGCNPAPSRGDLEERVLAQQNGFAAVANLIEQFLGKAPGAGRTLGSVPANNRRRSQCGFTKSENLCVIPAKHARYNGVAVSWAVMSLPSTERRSRLPLSVPSQNS